jgi:hypothetical protein
VLAWLTWPPVEGQMNLNSDSTACLVLLVFQLVTFSFHSVFPPSFSFYTFKNRSVFIVLLSEFPFTSVNHDSMELVSWARRARRTNVAALNSPLRPFWYLVILSFYYPSLWFTSLFTGQPPAWWRKMTDIHPLALWPFRIPVHIHCSYTC